MFRGGQALGHYRQIGARELRHRRVELQHVPKIHVVVALAERLRDRRPIPVALKEYEACRRHEVERFQADARNSSLWFENVCQAITRQPVDFGYRLLHRREDPARITAHPWRYGVHLARQVGILVEARRRIVDTGQRLRALGAPRPR